MKYKRMSPRDEEEYFNSQYPQAYGAGLNLANLAHLLGIFSIGAGLFMPLFLPSVMGGLAIILAILSRGLNDRLQTTAKHAIALGIVGIGIQVFVFVSLFMSTARLLKDPEYHAYINQTSLQMNGQTFDEAVETFDKTLGTNLGELLGIDPAAE